MSLAHAMPSSEVKSLSLSRSGGRIEASEKGTKRELIKTREENCRKLLKARLGRAGTESVTFYRGQAVHPCCLCLCVSSRSKSSTHAHNHCNHVGENLVTQLLQLGVNVHVNVGIS